MSQIAIYEKEPHPIENTWSVDPSNIVYADEGDPLDLYRNNSQTGRRS